MILSTGEENPSGHSLLARMFILDIQKNDIQSKKLTACQRDAADGLYAQAMSGYLKWLSSRYKEISANMKMEITAIRDQVKIPEAHCRTSEMVANLALGFKYFLAFAVESEAINQIQADNLKHRCWNALRKAAESQVVHQKAIDPVNRFIELLSSALASGQAHLANREGYQPESPRSWGWREQRGSTYSEWKPQGTRMGWVDDEFLYLDPDASYKVALSMVGNSSDSFPLTAKTLRKRMSEQGLLIVEDKRETLLVRRTLEGQVRNVLQMNIAVLFSQEPDEPDNPDIDPDWPDGSRVYDPSPAPQSDSAIAIENCPQNTVPPSAGPIEAEFDEPDCQESQDCQVSTREGLEKMESREHCGNPGLHRGQSKLDDMAMHQAQIEFDKSMEVESPPDEEELVGVGSAEMEVV